MEHSIVTARSFLDIELLIVRKDACFVARKIELRLKSDKY